MLLPYLNKGLIEAGCDEAGRGCLAGAVYAAVVILPPDFQCELLNDSKQLTERQRYQLRPIIEQEAVAWAVGIVSPEEIDKINILNASFLAMHRAIDGLQVRPQHLLIDGNRFRKYKDLPHTTVVRTLPAELSASERWLPPSAPRKLGPVPSVPSSACLAPLCSPVRSCRPTLSTRRFCLIVSGLSARSSSSSCS